MSELSRLRLELKMMFVYQQLHVHPSTAITLMYNYFFRPAVYSFRTMPDASNIVEYGNNSMNSYHYLMQGWPTFFEPRSYFNVTSLLISTSSVSTMQTNTQSCQLGLIIRAVLHVGKVKINTSVGPLVVRHWHSSISNWCDKRHHWNTMVTGWVKVDYCSVNWPLHIDTSWVGKKVIIAVKHRWNAVPNCYSLRKRLWIWNIQINYAAPTLSEMFLLFFICKRSKLTNLSLTAVNYHSDLCQVHEMSLGSQSATRGQKVVNQKTDVVEPACFLIPVMHWGESARTCDCTKHGQGNDETHWTIKVEKKT